MVNTVFYLTLRCVNLYSLTRSLGTLAAEFAALSRALSLEFGCFRNANTPNATTTKAIKENKTLNTSVSNDSSPSSGEEPRTPGTIT